MHQGKANEIQSLRRNKENNISAENQSRMENNLAILFENSLVGLPGSELKVGNSWKP